MKAYRIVIEVERSTERKDGEIRTETILQEYNVAAESFEEAVEEANRLRLCAPEEESPEIITVHTILNTLRILPGKDNAAS